MSHECAGALQHAGQIRQRCAVKEPHIYVRSADIEVAEGTHPQTCNRTVILQDLQHFDPAFSHRLKPLKSVHIHALSSTHRWRDRIRRHRRIVPIPFSSSLHFAIRINVTWHIYPGKERDRSSVTRCFDRNDTGRIRMPETCICQWQTGQLNGCAPRNPPQAAGCSTSEWSGQAKPCIMINGNAIFHE
jgi:hypothetical protein